MNIKCALHNHTNLSDGEMSVSELLRNYYGAGFNVVAITDHNYVTVPHPLQMPKRVDDLIILHGLEWTLPNVHLIALEFPLRLKAERQEFIEHMKRARVSWIAHPNMEGITPKNFEIIARQIPLDGVEKYNSGHDCWQYDIEDFAGILYAGDDCHMFWMIGLSWIEMEVDSLDKETILENLKSGDFVLQNRSVE